MSVEIWKPIAGYELLYEVSNLGRVKSLKRNTTVGGIMKLQINRGYVQVSLCKQGRHCTKKLHRLVAEAFLPNPYAKPEVNHKDGNKKNNRVSNLEWSTGSENINHAFSTGLNKAGKNNKFSSKEVEMYTTNGMFIKTFPSMMEAQRQTGVNHCNIQGCCVGRNRTAGGYTWRYAEGGGVGDS